MNALLPDPAPALVDPEMLQRLFAAQGPRALALRGSSAAERLSLLQRLHGALVARRGALYAAFRQDFGKPEVEVELSEIMPVLEEIQHARRHLRRWMKPRRVRPTLTSLGCPAHIHSQPRGRCLIIGPWNYPVSTLLGPLVSALAAGNSVMLKPSEFTPAVNAVLRELLTEAFTPDTVAFCEGDVSTAQALLALPFDHFFFTGSTAVGRLVMQAAARHLASVTLELGGKSPAIVSDSVPMKDAAERIAFGKSLNAGQTCVAPDYVLVPSRRVEEFVSQYKEVVQGFFPRLSDNPDYTAIINERQLGRLRGYLDDAREKGATLVPLFAEGQQRRLPQTLLLNVSDDMKVMQEEIFGPLLPVIPYERLEDALAYVNQRPRPLALYYFGYDKAQQQRVLHETHSGGVCLNDTLLHVAQDDIPFGGVGPSGMGHYHGHEGFLTFSKAKGVFSKPRFNAARMIYPPYGKSIQKLVYKLFVR